MIATADPITDDPITDALQAKPKTVDVSGPIVLYGFGQLGRWTLDAMRKAGMADPLWVVDNDPKKWGATDSGVNCSTMCSPSKAILHVVTVYNGESIRRELHEHGYRVISFAEFYRATLLGKPGVAVPYGSLDDPDAIRRQIYSIRKGFDVWSDDASHEEYVGQIRYRISLETPPPALPASDIYFPPEQPFSENECFVDCGAFDGDSIVAFRSRRTGHKDRIIAVEADPANVDKLVTNTAPVLTDGTTMRIVQGAVSNRPGTVYFNATGTAGSAIADDGKLVVDAVRLDDVLASEMPTRIKMDIEGAEPRALVGATKTILRCKPMLAICLYHSPEHLWTIPLFLKALVPEYRLYLRRYGEDCWETVCYAVI